MTAQSAYVDLVSAWRAVKPPGPYVLPGDEQAIDRWGRKVDYSSFEQYCADTNFGRPDKRLHLGLVPIPYMGNLQAATVFLLNAQPGLHPIDYFSEQRFTAYRRMLLNNLHQKDVKPFPFLGPELSWHSGGDYWVGRFGDLPLKLAGSSGSLRAAREGLGERVAVLELVPYHGESFGVPDAVIDGLRSVALVQRFARENLLPRARNGEILVVVIRRQRDWGLPRLRNVVIYDSPHARGGYLTSKTPGGKEILRFLGA